MSLQDRRYTKITRDQVLDDLKNILKAKVGSLADFGESAFGRTILELFAANSDLNAAWIEESFKDSFLETSTSTQATYVGARSLGYSIRRPIPAKSGIGISLKRTGIYPNVKVSIAKGTQFSYSGQTLTAIDDMEFQFDRNDPNYENGLMKLNSGRSILAEGTVKNIQFASDGTKNQEFIIPDTTFSDWFGYNDPNYVEPDTQIDRINRFTVVTSDASLIDNPQTVAGYEDKIYWRISRRGLQDPSISPSSINDVEDFVDDSDSNKTLNYTVLLTTANDGRIKIEFGDGIISAIPFGIINIKYFSTKGETGNLLNVSGSNLDTNATGILITQIDGTESDLSISDLNIALTTDIRGGLNIETIESIKNNASQIYNTLDSLGSLNSYIVFLKRSSDIKYANAYGEDVLSKIRNNFDLRYSNIVRFTALKDLYRKKDENYYITDPFEYYLEGYKVNGLTYIWDYDYSEFQENIPEAVLDQKTRNLKTQLPLSGVIILKDDSPISMDVFIEDYVKPIIMQNQMPSIFNANLVPKDFVVPGSEIDTILDSLNRRGYITLGNGQHQYVPPIVHDMTMDINIVLFEGSNFSDIKTKIINSIYEYLKESTGFAVPIYRSKVESLVQKIPEVAGLNLKFREKGNQFSGLDISRMEWLGDETSQFINQIGVSINGFDGTLIYYYKTDVTQSDTEYTVDFTSQIEIRNAIKTHYTSKILDNSTGLVKSNLTEEDINEFTGKIWALAMNSVYNSLFNKFLIARTIGDILTSSKIYNVLEAIRGWYFNEGILNFKDTDSITSMVEDTDNSLGNYIIYTLEYVKLVRNILAPVVARRLIDDNGNVSRYSNQNEIVQFNISSSNITVSTSGPNTNGK